MTRTQVFGGLFLLALCGALAPMFVAAEDPKDVPKRVDDPSFVLQVSEANLAEINFGQLAAKQAQNADVRKFAQEMVTDHTKANKELNALAADKKWNVAAGMSRAHQARYDRLSRMEGATFDREYLTDQMKDHDVVIALFEDQSKNGTDAQLKAWASRTLPGLRDHQKMARDLNDKIGK
jgi:putative membrane protein